MSARGPLGRSRGRLGTWFELCLLCCLAWAGPARAAEGTARADATGSPPRTAFYHRTAFYYGSHVPSDLLAAYDQVVVEPDHLANLKAFAGRAARPVAYLSIGEVAKSSARAKHIDKSWVLAENGAWQSWVMDLENPGYQALLMRRFEELWASGYRGFFLDTLDSYRLAAAEKRDAGLRQALVDIILGLARRHPDVHLLLNRGFEVLPDVKSVVSGVVAESLFDRWDAATQRYRRVPEEDRRWLVGELGRVRALGLPVTVIDYRPPTERAEARETAREIAALGFEPWVTNATLDQVGIGSLEILPRRVLLLTNETGDTAPDALRFLAPVLEYLGYVPEHRRVPARWSDLDLGEGYQGVITWFGSAPLPPGYSDWMHAQRQRGVRFVSFGVPGFDMAGPEGEQLGLRVARAASTSSTRVLERDALVGFEAEPPQRPFDGPLVNVASDPTTRVHLRLSDAEGHAGVAVATTAWGGFALSHVLAVRGLHGERAWVIDPFAFLSEALALPLAPMPTVTTQNGRRLALLAVRPEGLAALAGHGQPSNAAALGEWLSAHHAWPHSLASTPTDPRSPISGVDAAAAASLLELGFFERAELRPGTTRLSGNDASLTDVSGLFAGRELVGPIALDSLFLSSGGAQAYPFRDVLATFARTETPRRLKPVFVDYHGYLIGNPGGRAALGAIYAWLQRGAFYPAFVSEYAALARAFGEQVVARELDGAFRYFGGERLATVRSPVALGWPTVDGAGGAAVVHPERDGIYTSFVPGGARRLAFGARQPAAPYIIQTNGAVHRFEKQAEAPGAGQPGAEQSGEGRPGDEPLASGSTLVRIELESHLPLELELGGLPKASPCELRFTRGQARGVTSEAGSLRLSLGVTTTGEARLSCRAALGDG